MLRMSEDVEAATQKIASALAGLEQVSFDLDINVHRTAHGKTSISIVVTLWFGDALSREVEGNDIDSLAKYCREVADRNLAKIREIAKANTITKE